MKQVYAWVMISLAMVGWIFCNVSHKAPNKPARHIYKGQSVSILFGDYKGCQGVVEERISYMWVSVKTYCKGAYLSVVVRMDQIK